MTGYDIAFPFIMLIWFVIMVGSAFILLTNEPSKKKEKSKSDIEEV